MFSEQLRATLKRCCQVNVHQPQPFFVCCSWHCSWHCSRRCSWSLVRPWCSAYCIKGKGTWGVHCEYPLQIFIVNVHECPWQGCSNRSAVNDSLRCKWFALLRMVLMCCEWFDVLRMAGYEGQWQTVHCEWLERHRL